MHLRSEHGQNNNYFVFYNLIKCDTQKEFIRFEGELYTRHSFRRSSAAVLVNKDGHVTDLEKTLFLGILHHVCII